MSDIVVFEGDGEIIICKSQWLIETVEEWFVKTGRNLVDYNVYRVTGKEAIRISNAVSVENVSTSEEIEIMELLPVELRSKLMGE